MKLEENSKKHARNLERGRGVWTEKKHTKR